MSLYRNWDQFRSQFPELAQTVKQLGAKLYQLGVEQSMGSEELATLSKSLDKAPEEAVRLLGLVPPLNNSQLLHTVFSLGGKMLFSLEAGKEC